MNSVHPSPRSTVFYAQKETMKSRKTKRHADSFDGKSDGTMFTFIAYVAFIGSAYIGSSAILHVGIMYVS